MRAFIAVPIPEEVRRRMAEAGTAALRGHGGVRLVRPEAMHVTLVFLGEIQAADVAAVRAAMEEAAAGVSRFTASLGPVGQFPPKRRPKVFYLALEEGAAECGRLYEGLHHRLARQFGLDSRPFTAHITLARVKDPRSVPQAEELALRVEARFPVSRCVLYESTLTPQGARYRRVETVTLSGAGGSPETHEEEC